MTIMCVKKARLWRLALLGFAAASLNGCILWGDDGYFRNREDDYLKADNIQPLVIPSDLDSGRIGELYEIPPITEVDDAFRPEANRYAVPRPQPLSTNMLEERVRIQRLQEQRWILMNVSPGEVWPRVRHFLNQNDLGVERADTSLGLLETSWVEFRTDPTNYDRYRIQIDRGVHADTTEIHILHMSAPQEQVQAGDIPDWPSRSSSGERESWLLDELAATLAADADTVGTSLLAQDIGGRTKAGVQMRGAEPVLNLELDMERAIATLTHATNREGFTQLDRDSSAGVYYLHYRRPPDSEPGWFRRTFTRAGRAQPEPSSPYTLDALLANLPENVLEAPGDGSAERASPDAPGYLLVVRGEAGSVDAYLRDPYGQRLPSRQARELLTILRNNLL
ncbi:outer membrane protein assembly factor BamC [Marinimicrobium alkaliphilum]|uniref:outer membrane protein assembly factor BamC n=1 Tax=Marinimicrobium alkaliphilum TaxID=2202654 RepID=UPI001E58B483|nr:outer membrane protein assembly factor BamC [Marinimicrobium alkaliphilum]